MMGGLTSSTPMIVQQQSSGMQLILRPQGPAGQAQVQATQHTTQTQVQQSKSVVLGNGSGLGAPGTVFITHPQVQAAKTVLAYLFFDA